MNFSKIMAFLDLNNVFQEKKNHLNNEPMSWSTMKILLSFKKLNRFHKIAKQRLFVEWRKSDSFNIFH